MSALPSTKIAPRCKLLIAKFPGRCACGEKVKTGDSIAFSGSYDHKIVGCSRCDFGTFGDMSADALLEGARSYMALANNAINIRATDGSVGRLLTRNELMANAYGVATAHLRAA